MSNHPVDSTERIFRTCLMVAKCVSNPERHPLATARATRLLFMTAAHESDNFKARRQYGYQRESTGGAFGLWQVEVNNMKSSAAYVDRKPDVRKACNFVVTASCNREYMPPRDVGWREWFDGHGYRSTLLRLQEVQGDALGALLARLSYLRVSEALPAHDNIGGMGVYAKKYHNTSAGKATSGDYVDAYRRWWRHSFDDALGIRMPE